MPKPIEYPFAARSVKSSNPYRPACQWYALTQNGSPGRKAQENIIVPATLVAAAERKNKRRKCNPAEIMSAHRERYGTADPWKCAVFIRVD